MQNDHQILYCCNITHIYEKEHIKAHTPFVARSSAWRLMAASAAAWACVVVTVLGYEQWKWWIRNWCMMNQLPWEVKKNNIIEMILKFYIGMYCCWITCINENT